MLKPRFCPCRYGCVSPGEKDENGGRRHRFGCRETRSAIITLLLRARRFNATLDDGEGVSFATLAQREGAAAPISCGSSASAIWRRIPPGDPRWAAAGRFDGREAPRALPSAACLALISGSCSALLEPDPNLKIYRSTDLPRVKPGATTSRTAARPYRPVIFLPPVDAISKHPAR